MESYLTARKALGLSREKLSGLARRAGFNISAVTIAKFESEGEKIIGTRGLSEQAADWLMSILGFGDFAEVDWATVEKGAPVVVAGEKGEFSLVSVNEDGSITVFGQNFRSFTMDRVRLIAPTALPPVENAAMFETRTRGGGGQYAQTVMTYIQAHPGQPHSVGAMAVALSMDNALVSRTTAALVKAGKLTKVGRGVVRLPITVAAQPAEAVLSIEF
jgi:hypothetical protein